MAARPLLSRQKTVYVSGNGPSEPISDKYVLGASIGTPGNFGKAQVCTLKETGQKYCCKIVNKARFHHVGALHKIWDDMRNEISILQELQHANVVEFKDVFETRKELFIVTELCVGSELFERISKRGQYNEKNAADIFAQLLAGLAYMHSQGVVHCDLKPDNFLFVDKTEASTIKIIDFGMSKRVPRRKKLNQLCGTPYYTAPEILKRSYSHAADMWSIGVVLFVMLFGYPPFYVDPSLYGRKENEMIYRKIKKGFEPKVKKGYGSHFPAAIPVSEEVKDLISHLLDLDPSKRLTAAEALDHEWIRNRDSNSNEIPQTVIHAMQAFVNTNNFKNYVCHTFRGLLHPSQVKLVMDSFEKLDKNGDGQITEDEFADVMKDRLGSRAEIVEVFNKLDTDGNHVIDYKELAAAAYAEHIQAQDERLYEQFTRFDIDGDGCVTVEEMKKGLKEEMMRQKEQGEECHFTWEEAEKAIDDVDQNSDGQIDYNEFLAALYPEYNEKFDLPAELVSDNTSDSTSKPGPPRLLKGNTDEEVLKD